MSTMTQPTPSRDAYRIDTAEAAEQLCTRLTETVTELVALLDRETGMLRTGKPHEIVALHARKSALGAALSTDMDALRRDADFIRMAVPQRLETLRDQRQAFEASLLANQEALAAMKSVSESLLRVVANKVGERRAGADTYGQDAALTGTKSNRPAAIAVDRSL